MRAATGIASALLSMVVPTAAVAQQVPYPNRPITWVVPSGAGGVTDNSARFLAKVLSEKLGQPIVVDNKPGAGGIVGTEAVAQAKPDGYTMLYASQSTMATFPSLYKKLSYSPLKSLVPVNGMADSSLLMVVNAAAPYTTVEELIAHLKKNPGKMNFGSSGTGTSTHLLGEMFQMATGTSMVHVPYKTPSNLYADLLSGTIDVIFDFTVVMRPHIEAGKLRPLAIAREDRLKSFPNVPTFRERGLDIVLTAWASIAMPAGTPPEIVNKMSAAFAETTRDPVIIKYNDENDFGNLGHLGPEKLREFYISETEKFKKVVEKAGVTLD
ncbi:tripartite tricarboxylate transporter substrate binding protein [Bradyrhizobium sp. LHD-71]|uniref:Bug family tripartite tricarboxylate transporter substrate binding protein n=1 Tax=Bradyrhizobium sp. LHD-71 TaxID=3072141 RepID=UPI00280DC3A0|nr:tripartite tricarboxylate transporter substrate binding protein [Bradyrhizobium sp. LHD-71]MDQ8729735.1 tripartite tricarboxylate transporter substrate binding protein [Bradyrhizobium sp. LHD-71]